jgi:ADP-ribosylglycohydrolase
MLPQSPLVRSRLRWRIAEMGQQGFAIDGLRDELGDVPDSYDALAAFATRLENAERVADWPYDEPDDLAAIWAAADPARATTRVATIADAAARAGAAFEASVCGCVLGKPFEINPTLAEIEAACTPTGEWPLRDYPTEKAVRSQRMLQTQLPELVREGITHVAADDDINYTVLGMRVLEEHGTDFTRQPLMASWLYNLPTVLTFGPERNAVVRAALDALEPGAVPDLETWVASAWNPGQELCGALIRADAYGYACLGHPALAAELAWRDAGMTHRSTGVYGAMFVGAAIAAAPLSDDPLAMFVTALQYVPQNSRFAEAVRFGLEVVGNATDWRAAYDVIHDRYGEYSHCRILQEIGTLMNSVRFARVVADGFCLQVMQGNDTDSFGATSGSFLGAFFGRGHLVRRWVEPFNDRIHLALATTWISTLSKLIDRMSALPAVVP